MSTRWLIPILSLGFAAACTASGGDPETPEVERQAGETAEPEATPELEPEPEPAVTTTVSVSSVQMIQDCPDTEVEDAVDQDRAPPASKPKPAPGYTSKAARRAKGGSNRPMRKHCTQSAVQLALESAGEAPVTVEIKAVRLLAKGETVGTLVTRKPKIWTDNRYDPWDESLAPGQPTKASYKLGVPNWNEVESKLDGGSYGQMFTLEIDIAIDGVVQTVSSPEFAREKPHVMVT